MEGRALDLINLNVPALRVAQAHIAEIGRRRGGILLGLPETAG
jgi:hypothetical protein